MTTPGTEDAGTVPNAFDLAMRRLVVVAIVALISAVVWHEVRLGVIESNRFTTGAAYELERRLQTELPPDWLRTDVRELKSLVRDVNARLVRMESKFEALDGK
jgi:hypothetical protein